MKTGVVQLLEVAPQLSAGILTADLLHLDAELQALEEAGVHLVHVDVMDGHFCPPLTVGAPIVQAIPETFVKDVHLMVDNPLSALDAFIDARADILTVHVEATAHAHRVLQSLEGTGVVRGIALNPGTPVAVVEPLLEMCELLLLLAVNPGWAGQAFIPGTQRRIIEARELVKDLPVVLAVDGGVTRENIAYVASLGADIIVSGKGVYDGGDAVKNATSLRTALAGN